MSVDLPDLAVTAAISRDLLSIPSNCGVLPMQPAGEDSAVGVGERGLEDLTLQDQQLVPQRQDLHVLLSVAHRQQSQERKGVGHGETRKTQQHENHDAVDALRRWRQQGEGRRSRRSGIKRFTWADELSAPA
ncbi:hypothetical protein OOK47_00340 [Streptomyces sp. NBC_00268]|nr:hypothetical protein [Streptomyces sp. NBC_00268]